MTGYTMKEKAGIAAGQAGAIASRSVPQRDGMAYGSLRSPARPAEAVFILLIAMTM
jgi:hypothetical protein